MVIASFRNWRRTTFCVVSTMAAIISIIRFMISHDFEVATAVPQESAKAIAALRRLAYWDQSFFQRACIQVISSDDYDDYVRTRCLLELGNSYSQKGDQSLSLIQDDWFDPNWLDPRRATMWGLSCQDEYLEFPRMEMLAGLNCPFATRTGLEIIFTVRGVPRREYTDCVRALQRRQTPIVNFTMSTFRTRPVLAMADRQE